MPWRLVLDGRRMDGVVERGWEEGWRLDRK